MRSGWILATALLAALMVGGAGWVQWQTQREPAPAPPQQFDHKPPPKRPPGFWNEAPERAAWDQSEAQLIARLEAIGYAAGTQPAQRSGGGVTRRPDAGHAGARLYASGHAPEAVLIDAAGIELHRWHFDPAAVWPDAVERRAAGYFRRATVLANGDLLAIFEGIGLVKLDRDSQLLWSAVDGAHHGLDVLPDGRIFVLARTAHLVPELDPERPTLEDFIVELSPDGTELRRVSLVEALLASEFAELSKELDPRLPKKAQAHVRGGDVYHTNSIQVLRESHPSDPRLRAGSVLVSLRHLNALMVVDLHAGTVPWLLRGEFLLQHEARLLRDGTLLLFDNRTRGPGSRALQLSVDGETLWQHPAAGAPRGFFTSCCGTVQRLANGNTMVVVTEAGIALEVTPENEVVWEFSSPHRTGARNELVAGLFDMVALPEDFPLGWIPALAARD